MIKRFFKLIGFVLFYLKEVIKTNLILAYEVITPTHYMEPGFIKMDVEGLSDRQLLVFCNLITMTPGSMVVNVSDCKKFVYLHILYLENRKDTENEIRETYLKKVKEVF